LNNPPFPHKPSTPLVAYLSRPEPESLAEYLVAFANSDGGTILNLSAEGCAITSESVASAKAYLQLTIQLREQEEPLQVDLAAVRWSSATRFGVEFIKIRPEEGERLKKFVEALESTT